MSLPKNSRANYAIKVASVRILLQRFTSGAAAPYFGCYAPMRTFLIFILIFAAAGLSSCAHADVYYSELPSDAFTVPQEKLHVIISSDGSIPEKYWGKPIRQLKPLRVIRHRINIAVVTSETDQTISGVYFSVLTSSYLPMDSDTETYVRGSKDNLLRFTFKK